MRITTNEWLARATKQLKASGIGTARLDCLVLLEDCLNKNRTQILASPDLLLSAEQLAWLGSRIKRRAEHEPLAYIRGKTEFYGREFIVNKHVLEPRPESEAIITLLKTLPEHKNFISKDHPWKTWKIVDVGTGSGALAITAKLEMSAIEAAAVDIDPACLEIATQNANKHHADIALFEGNLLEPFMRAGLNTCRSSLILLCNLPYIPDDFQINLAAQAEPRIAIFGGSDGLDLYRRLFAQLRSFGHKPNFILTESLPPQHQKLAEIAQAAGFRLTKTEDFIQQFEPLS